MRRAREVWAELIRQHEQSGLRTEAFAEKRGIPVKTLRWWTWKLRRESEDAPSLLPVRVIPATAHEGGGSDESTSVEVELACGTRLHFVGTPVGAVVEVVSRLRRC
jgi:hypothetical protein